MTSPATRLMDLEKSVEYHVEEKELFDKARGVINQEESGRIARDFQSGKQKNIRKTG